LSFLVKSEEAVVKHINTIFICIAIASTNCYAAPEDFIGTFKGSETSTLTNCGGYNGTTTGSWLASHSDLKGNQFIGAGNNKDGEFTVTAEATDNTAIGTVKGVNKYGLAWKGEFKSTIEGSVYKSTTTGSVSSGCKFTSEITATKN
jgi:hypothetical protein